MGVFLGKMPFMALFMSIPQKFAGDSSYLGTHSMLKTDIPDGSWGFCSRFRSSFRMFFQAGVGFDRGLFLLFKNCYSSNSLKNCEAINL